jgi:Matrixin/Glucodextranase, domain B
MKCLKVSALLLVLASVGWSGGVIRLKTRSIEPAVSASPILTAESPNGAKQHYLVLFGSYPGADVLAELQIRHITVLAYVPENALMVSAVKLNLHGLDVLWVGPMDPGDKISPGLSNQPSGEYLVIWQPDTDSGDDTTLAQNLGFTVVPNSSLLAGQMLVSGAYSALPALAALDQVAYILPASAELQTGDAIVGCAGAITPVGPSPQYVTADRGWSKDANGNVSLGYYFDSLTPDVPESEVRSEIARAFAVWTQYANITISPAAQPAMERSIDVLFARYAHGDAYPFDGPGGVIAHTFYPVPSNPEPLAGDMHLNADESWSVGGTVDIFSVALHETGHALGLGHSDDPTSVMYPYYRLQTGLTPDDIAGIQSLYGPPASATPTSAAPSTGSSTTGTSGTGSTTATGTAASGTGSSTGSGAPATNSGAANPSTGTGSSTNTVPPTITIVSPASSMVSTSSANLTISGTASGNAGIASVAWTTSTGGAGTATGTVSWSASVPLLVGNNTVTVRAYDAAGNSSWRAITVVRNQ